MPTGVRCARVDVVDGPVIEESLGGWDQDREGAESGDEGADAGQYEHDEPGSAPGEPADDDEQPLRGRGASMPVTGPIGVDMRILSMDGCPLEGLSARWSRTAGTDRGS